MITEAEVAPENRYLLVAGKLSDTAFELERQRAIQWCAENPDRLDIPHRQALAELERCELSPQTVSLVIYYCYADIPANRVYGMAFDMRNPGLHEETEARLRFAIFARRLPMLALEHGHHHVVVFDFPEGVPDVIVAMPELAIGEVTGEIQVGLCDLGDWEAIRVLK